MFRTRVTEILGIEHPIVEGGMAMAGNGELAAAVSNGGGLGVVSSNPGWAPVEARTENVRAHIRRAKALTDRPLGANFPIFILGSYVDRHLEMLLEEGIRIVACSGGSPKAMTRKFKDAGLTVLHVVGNVKQARAAEDAGVDLVVCEGYEAGGVENPDELTTMVLTPCVVDAVKIPVLAAGGIADARGLVAAFALGAEGVQMGSAFLATRECHVHANFKDAIVRSGDTATVMTQRALGRLSRALKTEFTLELQELDRRGAADAIKARLADAPPGKDAQFLGQMEGDMRRGEPAAGQAPATWCATSWPARGRSSPAGSAREEETVRVIRFLFKLVVALALLGAIAFFAPRFVHDGPLGPIPGGPLRAGPRVDAPVSDWSFARDVLEIELQLESQGRSRTTWILVRDGVAWVPCSLGFPPGKSWYRDAQQDGRAILRIEGKRYPVTLTRDDDPGLGEFARTEVARKYVNGPPGNAGALFFRVASRAAE